MLFLCPVSGGSISQHLQPSLMPLKSNGINSKSNINDCKHNMGLINIKIKSEKSLLHQQQCNYDIHNLQCANLEGFHPEILKKSNHILRNCKNADIGTFQVGGQISMVTRPWRSIATFLYSRIGNFSTVLTKNKFMGRNFLNLHTVL